MVTLVVGVVALAVGFGLGRVKNKAKLAAVSAELMKIEGEAVADVKSVVARIKAAL